ncbi:hypothetical protein RvY_07936 [Ramazzottius varieornatus]|uniref:Uncharacterized protein n=1 Tax=Ramazzottius varieornatus TaxID=947166 RepID=A0A1D1V458_RAMVA|nr:hypothetical protein RvY_07936 [Ramazzottius varieornatus]
MKTLQHKKLFSAVTTDKHELNKAAPPKCRARLPSIAPTSPERTEANDSLDDDETTTPPETHTFSSFPKVAIAPLINTDCSPTQFPLCPDVRPLNSVPGSTVQPKALFQARCRSSIQDEQSESMKKPKPSRRYTLRNYRELQLDIKLGGLGPDIGIEQERARQRKSQLKKLASQWSRQNKEELEKSKLRQEARAKSAQLNSSSQDSKHDDETASSHSGNGPHITIAPSETARTSARCDEHEAGKQSRTIGRMPRNILPRPGAQDPVKKNAQEVRKALEKSREMEEWARRQLNTLHEALRLGQAICSGPSGDTAEFPFNADGTF